MKTLDNNAPIH